MCGRGREGSGALPGVFGWLTWSSGSGGGGGWRGWRGHAHGIAQVVVAAAVIEALSEVGWYWLRYYLR